MRELFDDVYGKPGFTVQESREKSTGTRRKRFYTKVGVSAADEGHSVTLDDKTIRTPSRNALAVPSRAVADLMAAEWDAQQEFIDPLSMPITRLANSVLDAISTEEQIAAVRDDIAKYFGSDLLFYRASHPDALIEREAAAWDPVLFWVAEELNAHFILAEGVMHVGQPAQALAAAQAALPTDSWRVAALHMVTTITGSALLALALLRGRLSADEVWAAAFVDEDWNAEKWGLDEEAAARRAARKVDFEGAVAVLRALGS
ncbi:ATP12 family chaperone protein [Tardiphaga sp.]|jgi:chaperone required for assembly of F1-ATPase|uniref:ATP12 family chaperone protein n=1 Tax=Tardiphaga sp. TaxID=1926292 RepID=UPI0037DA35A6